MKELAYTVQSMHDVCQRPHTVEYANDMMQSTCIEIDELITKLTELKELTKANIEGVSKNPVGHKDKPAQLAWMLAIELHVLCPGCFDEPLNSEIVYYLQDNPYWDGL